jgi:hypothetical protein
MMNQLAIKNAKLLVKFAETAKENTLVPLKLKSKTLSSPQIQSLVIA